jgi:hypothetical protein
MPSAAGTGGAEMAGALVPNTLSDALGSTPAATFTADAGTLLSGGGGAVVAALQGAELLGLPARADHLSLSNGIGYAYFLPNWKALESNASAIGASVDEEIIDLVNKNPISYETALIFLFVAIFLLAVDVTLGAKATDMIRAKLGKTPIATSDPVPSLDVDEAASKKTDPDSKEEGDADASYTLEDAQGDDANSDKEEGRGSKDKLLFILACSFSVNFLLPRAASSRHACLTDSLCPHPALC